MSAQAAINRLLAIHPKGFDLSLERITDLLAKLDNPHKKIPPAIHVAGTNGKGSVCAFLRAILEASGRRVHVHTSPHLVNWYERYRLGYKDDNKSAGKFVSDSKLKDAIERAEKANGGRPITVFEIMSAVGFLLFSENEADYSIIEVGLGGRFDATNVIDNPAATIITPVALDHQAYLGDNLAKIAFEKAGIIKRKCPVIIGQQSDEALEVLRDQAEKNNAPVKIFRQDFDYYIEHGRFIFNDEHGLIDIAQPKLLGEHQLENAALAIAAIRQLHPDTPSNEINQAMGTIYWPGRFERLSPGQLIKSLPLLADNKTEIWIDGGHNPHAGRVIAAQLKKMQAQLGSNIPLIMIAGMLTTKEAGGYFSCFQDLVEEVYCVPVNQSEAGFTPEELTLVANKAGLSASPSKSVASALEKISQKYHGQQIRILIGGSFYLIGEVLAENGTPPQ